MHGYLRTSPMSLNEYILGRLGNNKFHILLLQDHQCGEDRYPHRTTGIHLENKCVMSLTNNLRSGNCYDDKLSFFRALVMLNKCRRRGLCKYWRPNDTNTTNLFHLWMTRSGYDDHADFKRVSMDDLLVLEKFFKVSIIVFKVVPNNIGTFIWRSESKFEQNLNFNLYKQHFRLIKASLDRPSKPLTHNCSSRTIAYDCLLDATEPSLQFLTY